MPTSSQFDKSKIVATYEKQADIFLARLLQVVARAQRKADDPAYKKVLEGLENIHGES